MFRSNIIKAHQEVKDLVKEAKDLLQQANSAGTEKADDLRTKGLRLLDKSITKAQQLQEVGMEKGKQVATKTNDYIQKNPWRSMAYSGVVLMAIGLLIGRSRTRK